MNAWLADGSNLATHENGAFQPATIDPSAAFLHPSPTQQDPSQYQRMFNSVARNVSPSFQNPNQVIPSKRPRPEDGISLSPRQAPGVLSGSRSQTPHQVPYPGFQGPTNGTPQFAPHPGPYPHLQPGASPSVSQSPIMQDFDPQAIQRMSTASPSPFAAPGPHAGPQMSPPQSDHGSRVNTPQNNHFIQGQTFPQGIAPQFAPATAMNPGQMPGPMSAQFNSMPQGYQQAMVAQQQRLYAMQMQNQSRAMSMNNSALAGRPGSSGINPMANPQHMAALRQMHQQQQQQQQNHMAKPTNPEAFIRSLSKFMASRNLPLDPNPIVSGRPVNLVQLYATVMKLGGSKKATASNAWTAIAQQLGYQPMQCPTAAQEIQGHYQRNLAVYEQAFLNTQQSKPPGDQVQQKGAQRPTGQTPPSKSTPVFEPPPQNQELMANHAASNGVATPTTSKAQGKKGQRKEAAASRQAQAKVQPQEAPAQFAGRSPAPTGKASGSAAVHVPAAIESRSDQPLQYRIEDPFKPAVLPPSHLHGPIVIDELYQIGEDIARFKPTVPAFPELGIVDIHALTMCLQSGLHAEIRMALDTLTTLSCEPTVHISLENCEDLVESLIECAEDQAELLAEHAIEVSDVMLLPSYEEVTRACQLEISSLADVPDFGSLDYDLDRAVDRLICVTTILRNFSFTESNFGVLGIAPVIKFASTIIRYLGTRNKFLRTYRNTLDFMKDAVIFLSNLAHTVQLPGREEALCLLQFLLSFAPSPIPTVAADEVTFAPYAPSLHKYTPAAVDCLAKLLARDEPNRTFFKSLLSSDGTPGAQQELLTRAFGLAICAVPDQFRKPLMLSDSRKVFLMQGLLAADILSAFADGGLAKAWLESPDGFATHLLRLTCQMSTERLAPPNARLTSAMKAQIEADAYVYGAIIDRGLCILRRLSEKSRTIDGSSTMRLPVAIAPTKENLLEALLTPTINPVVLRQLIGYAQIAERETT